MDKALLRKYASLAVRSGVNVQPGQLLVINAQANQYEFAGLCVEEAYKVHAGKVMVNYVDENLQHLDMLNCTTETLCDIPDYLYEARKYAQDKKACFLSIVSETPGLFADVDSTKISSYQQARNKKMSPLYRYMMNNEGQWCVIALPTVGWAKKVFPDLEEKEALQALWKAILQSVKVDENNDPVEIWTQHDKKLKYYCSVLNKHHFQKLHFTNSLGTDLYVGLVKKHNWVGGSSLSTSNVQFNPNMPTEEVFCMPDKYNTNGTVYASKPLSYNGKVIDKFNFTFTDGKVTDYHAEKGEDILKSLLESDEGSRYLGEVALISYNSPLSLSNILFYETLFDENASCHLALGASYPENVIGGMNMDDEQLAQEGANDSIIHVDFMFGTPDLKVEGIKEDGQKIIVFDKGNFVF
ncbi:MAG: aminopeptidase [Erysipelotrichia bacterium]|nr:aminopeptidase [Erysipelotrichia bacterium]